MSIPGVDLRVEIAFNAGYRTPAVDRVWTDISDYVELIEGLDIDYGRSDEYSTADANAVSLTLDNTDARFTWGNTSSPYYPNLKIGRPIRVIATVAAVDYVRFTGYVNEWPVAWPGGGDTYSTVPLAASSRLARLGLDSPIVDPVAETVGVVGPDYYWPLTEPAGSIAAAEATGSDDLALRIAQRPNKVAFGYDDSEAPFGAGDGLTALKMSGEPAGELTLAGRLEANMPEISFGPGVPGAVSIAFLVRNLQPGAASTGSISMLELLDPSLERGYATYVAFPLSEIGELAAVNYPTGGGALDGRSVFAPVALAESGALHHAALTVSCDGVNVTLNGYLDGSLVDTNTFTAVDFRFSRLKISSPQYDVLIGRVAIWESEASALEIADLANAGLDGFSGDTTDVRLQRVAIWAGIPAAEVTVTPSPVALAGIGSSDARPLELMRVAETAEAGVLYDDREGDLVLKPRASRYGVTSSLTLDVAAQHVGADYAPKVDRQGLVNFGRGTNTLGTVNVTYSNETSRDELGDAAYDVETAALDPDEPLQLVAWVVNANSEPRPRAPSVTLNVLNWVGGSIGALLGLDIGSKVTVSNAPEQAPSAASDYYVEGYSEAFGEASWFITLNLSPSAPAEDVFILNSATYGVLDSNVLAL